MRYKTYSLFVLFAISALLMQRADAHSSIMATYLFEKKENNEWVLTVSLPLSGLHQALLTHHKEEDLWIKENEYNVPLVIKYLKEKSNIKANTTNQVQLDQLNVQLGSHQSNFIFKLNNLPENIKSFDFLIPAMSENSGQVNIVRVKGVGRNKKVVLQFKNNYSGHLDL